MYFPLTSILLLFLLTPLATSAFFRAPTPPKAPSNPNSGGNFGSYNSPPKSNSRPIGSTPKDKDKENPEIPEIGGPDSPSYESEKGSRTTAASKEKCTGWGMLGPVEATGTQYCTTTSTSKRVWPTGYGVSPTTTTGSGFTPTATPVRPFSNSGHGLGREGLGWGVGVGFGVLGVLGVL